MLPKALKSCTKSKKLTNLVTLIMRRRMRFRLQVSDEKKLQEGESKVKKERQKAEEEERKKV